MLLAYKTVLIMLTNTFICIWEILEEQWVVFAPTYPFYFMTFFQGVTVLPQPLISCSTFRLEPHTLHLVKVLHCRSSFLKEESSSGFATVIYQLHLLTAWFQAIRSKQSIIQCTWNTTGNEPSVQVRITLVICYDPPDRK